MMFQRIHKGGFITMKALDYVNSAKHQLTNLKSELNQAVSSAEKQANKSHIQHAMSSIDAALNELGKYQD